MLPRRNYRRDIEIGCIHTYIQRRRWQPSWDEGTLIEMKPCERKILWGEFYAGPFLPSFARALELALLISFLDFASVARRWMTAIFPKSNRSVNLSLRRLSENRFLRRITYAIDANFTPHRGEISGYIIKPTIRRCKLFNVLRGRILYSFESTAI